MQTRKKGKKEEINEGINKILQAIQAVADYCLFLALEGHTTAYMNLHYRLLANAVALVSCSRYVHTKN